MPYWRSGDDMHEGESTYMSGSDVQVTVTKTLLSASERCTSPVER